MIGRVISNEFLFLEGVKMFCGVVEEGLIEGVVGLLKVENGEV